MRFGNTTRLGAVFAVAVTILGLGTVDATAAPAPKPTLSAHGVQLTTGAPRSAAPAPKAIALSRYASYAPFRLFDSTKDGKTLHQGTVSTLLFEPDANLPADATAIVLNLTATNVSANTFVTAFPAGTARPGVASLNLSPKTIRSNQVVVPLGRAKDPKGASVPAISFYNNVGNTDIIGDLSGIYRGSAGPGTNGYTALAPTRVLDTRNGTGGSGPLGQGKELNLDLSKIIPTGTVAVTLNLTGIASTGTYVTAYPGGTRPSASSLNIDAGKTTPNQVTVQVTGDRTLKMYNNAGTTNLIADIQGYYANNGASAYQPVNPVRIADTRDGSGTSGVRGAIGPGAASTFSFSGQAPSNATAATVNLTGISPSANTFLTAYASGAQRPTASTLNLVPGQTSSNLANAPLGSDALNVYNNAGSTNVAIDMSGYFVPQS